MNVGDKVTIDYTKISERYKQTFERLFGNKIFVISEICLGFGRLKMIYLKGIVGWVDSHSLKIAEEGLII